MLVFSGLLRFKSSGYHIPDKEDVLKNYKINSSLKKQGVFIIYLANIFVFSKDFFRSTDGLSQVFTQKTINSFHIQNAPFGCNNFIRMQLKFYVVKP